MDPITHGALGAAAALAFARPTEPTRGKLPELGRGTLLEPRRSNIPEPRRSGPPEQRVALGLGAFAGMLTDIDILIDSPSDPLLGLEYHRHFTHALAFIPVGGLVAALIAWFGLQRFARRWGASPSFARLFLFATVAYATHGLLDACTTYGTQLLQPFSSERVAWNVVAIIDPVYTLLLMGAVIWAMRQRRAQPVWLGLGLSAMYLLFGSWQHERAENFLRLVAAQRGHAPDRLMLSPTIGNLAVWRSLYEWDGALYVDAVRVGYLGGARLYEGAWLAKFEPREMEPAPSPDSTLGRDLARFSWFADGWVAGHPDDRNVVGDLRYALVPNGRRPLWGIRIDGPPDRHVAFLNFRELERGGWSDFVAMIRGEDLEGR